MTTDPQQEKQRAWIEAKLREADFFNAHIANNGGKSIPVEDLTEWLKLDEEQQRLHDLWQRTAAR